MRATQDASVPMRDGTALAADVYRPDADAPVPALLALSPYGKGKQVLMRSPQPGGSPLWDGGVEAGDPEYLTEHGYAHVIADLRGTGHSEGDFRGWMSKQSAEDGHDLVEWIAAQPWCDGNVGMVGISWFGAMQLHVASEQPPHLKAIMPWNAPADFYREGTYHGGILQSFFHDLYMRSARGRNVLVSAEEHTPDELARLLKSARSDPDLRMYSRFWHLVDNPHVSPSFLDVLLHPLDGPYYWERSPNRHYDRIRIPVYARSAWWSYAHMHLRGAFEHFNGLAGPVKVRIDSEQEEERPLGADYNREVVRWYDHWLKGAQTGIMDEPPLSLYILGAERWRHAAEWPLASARWTRFYLRTWGRLLPDPEPVDGHPDEFVQQPLYQTTEAARLRYITPPFASDTEITGPVSLELYASIDQDDTHWIVAVKDVGPDGFERELTRGFLKASHRALDEERSREWLPYHPHREEEPVPAGEVVRYSIEVSPMSNLFRAGHALALEITSLDHLSDPGPQPGISAGHLPYHLSSSRTTRHVVEHDRRHPSSLLLSVIPHEDVGAAA